MCGIAGIVALDATACRRRRSTSSSAMAGALRHRGPDEFGALPRRARRARPRAAVDHRSRRPASSRSANEDGTLWVVFNGEIFNYVELREELVALGHGSAPRATPR